MYQFFVVYFLQIYLSWYTNHTVCTVRLICQQECFNNCNDLCVIALGQLNIWTGTTCKVLKNYH